MGKKTISLNLDDFGDGDALVSSILNNAKTSNKSTNNTSTKEYKKSSKGYYEKGKGKWKKQDELSNVEKTSKNNSNKKNNEKGNVNKKIIVNKTGNDGGTAESEKIQKTLQIDLGDDIKPELSLADIELEKPKAKKRAKSKAITFENDKMAKVAKLDDFFNISKNENTNSLTHPKTKDYQVGKQEAEIKLESIQSQISKINSKISKKGRNKVDPKYIDSLKKLLKKEEKYINILNSFQQKNEFAMLDRKNENLKTQNYGHILSYPTDIRLNKSSNFLNKNDKIMTPKTRTVISEIDAEMDKVNRLLDLTEGKKGKYKGLKPEPFQDYGMKTKPINKSGNESKSINIGMDLDGVHYIPNMDVDKLRDSKNNKNNKDGKNGINKNGLNQSNIKKEITPPKTMFSVKANLMALKEREKMLAKQKRKIQEKLEFKKKQILKAKQQEKEMKKIRALEQEKRRLFELDREVKRLDRMRYQQSLEMKNTMKQLAQKDILAQQNIDNIQKEEFINSLGRQKQYQPFTYNFNNTPFNKQSNTTGRQNTNSPNIFRKIHNNLMNMGVGEQVLFKQKHQKGNTNENINTSIIGNKSNNNTNMELTEKIILTHEQPIKTNSKKLETKKGYKYIKKDYVDTNIDWLEWKKAHLDYFNKSNIHNNDSISYETSVYVLPYTTYNAYLQQFCLCEKEEFSNTTKNELKVNIPTKSLLTNFKRNIYTKTHLDERKEELCQYMGIINRENMNTLLNLAIKNTLPLKKENNSLLLLKIWYSCFEDGKMVLSNGSNKVFSQKKEKVEEIH